MIFVELSRLARIIKGTFCFLAQLRKNRKADSVGKQMRPIVPCEAKIDCHAEVIQWASLTLKLLSKCYRVEMVAWT